MKNLFVLYILLNLVNYSYGFKLPSYSENTCRTGNEFADSQSIRLALDTILCTKSLITPSDFYYDLSQRIESIMGTGNGGNGTSEVSTSILKPSLSGTYGFALNKQKGNGSIQKQKQPNLYLNIGGGLGFVGFINEINIENPNVNFDINTELSIFFHTRAKYYPEECLRYSNVYEDFMVPYLFYQRSVKNIESKLDDIKKTQGRMIFRRDTDVIEIDTILKSTRNYKVLFQRSAYNKPSKHISHPKNGSFQYTYLDSNKIVTYFSYYKSGIGMLTGIDSLISSGDTIFKIRYRRESKDSLLLRALLSKLHNMETTHDHLLRTAPFNTRMFNSVNIDMSYKLESYLIYNGQSTFNEENLYRTTGSIYSIGINYNFYHFVTTRYLHDSRSYMAWGGNKYLRVGLKLLFTNAGEDGGNGPYKIAISDTLPGGLPYVSKNIYVFTPGVFARYIDLVPHMDFYIMENSRTVGLHLMTNYFYAMDNNITNGNRLNAGMGMLISVGNKFAKQINQLKGIPVNFEIMLTASNILHWHSDLKFTDKFIPNLRVNLPLNLIGL